MQNNFFIRTNGKYLKINFQKVLYIEGCKKYFKAGQSGCLPYAGAGYANSEAMAGGFSLFLCAIIINPLVFTGGFSS